MTIRERLILALGAGALYASPDVLSFVYTGLTGLAQSILVGAGTTALLLLPRANLGESDWRFDHAADVLYATHLRARDMAEVGCTNRQWRRTGIDIVPKRCPAIYDPLCISRDFLSRHHVNHCRIDERDAESVGTVIASWHERVERVTRIAKA